jgi:hypothetical protein
MPKKNNEKPSMVSSVSSMLKRVYNYNGEQVTTPEETKQRKQGFLQLLDMASEKLTENIKAGKIDLSSTMDMERVIKLTLLVSGEADSIKGKVNSEESETSMEGARLSMSQIDKILDVNDPDVQEMYQKLYEGYNRINDEADM